MFRKDTLHMVRETYIVVITVLLWVVIAIVNKNFANPSYIIELLGSNGVYFVCAMGILPLMIMKHIDLSVGGIMLITSMIVSMIYSIVSLPIWIVMFIGMVVGGLVGYLNGKIISYFKVSSVIVTIAMLSLYRGISRYWFRQNTGGNFQTDIFEYGLKDFFGIPIQSIIIMIVCLLTVYILKYHPVGRMIYAIGENTENARRLGFDRGRVTRFVYCYSGILAGLAAFIHMSLLGSSNIEAYNGIEFELIIILIIGGLNILGGYGTVHGTFFATTFVIILKSGLIFAQIPAFWHNMVIGVIILLIISYDMIKRKLTNMSMLNVGGFVDE